MRTVVMLVSEDSLIPKKLRHKMPKGWEFGDDIFARYEGLDIVLVENPLNLKYR